MTPNPNPSPEDKKLAEDAYSDGYEFFRNKWIGDHVEMNADLVRHFVPRALSPQTLPAPGEVERLRQALRNIAEGNLGDAPWQANYARIKEVADEALAAQPATAEPFGYWIEQRLAEPVLLRKPSYIPEPSELRTVTPLYVSPTLATVAAANDEGVAEALIAEWQTEKAEWRGNNDLIDRTIRALATSRSQHEGASS